MPIRAQDVVLVDALYRMSNIQSLHLSLQNPRLFGKRLYGKLAMKPTKKSGEERFLPNLQKLQLMGDTKLDKKTVQGLVTKIRSSRESFSFLDAELKYGKRVPRYPGCVEDEDEDEVEGERGGEEDEGGEGGDEE